MNSQGKTILLSAGLIFLYMKSQAFTAKAKGAITNSFTAFSDPVRLKLLQVNDALNSAGFSDPGKTFALSQVLHETGSFTSRSKVARENNNFSGIIWINKPGIQKNAIRGTARSKKEGGYYAKFNTAADWAADFKRLLSMKNKPLQAITLTDYVTRLHNNKYFTAPVKTYLSGMQKYYNLLTV